MADYNISGMGGEEEVVVRATLVGAGEVEAEAAAVSGSLEEMGVAADTAGKQMAGASRRSFLMGQAMFTLRRFIYQGTLALVAAGGAAAYFGLSFDASLQQSTIALTHFLGSSQAAKKELQSLYQLAAYTPFSFSDVTEAAKSMLSFGFSVKDTNYDLKVMADTMSGLGLSGQAVQQFTNDIVKMAARGKLMGQDIRELVSLHIPALAILQKQLGLTATQIQNIGLAGIPASTAIPALFRGLEEQYTNMAQKQSRTLAGRLSTLKDLTQEMLGTAMRPLFTWLQDVALPVVNEILNALQKGFSNGGFLGSLKELNRSNAPFWFKTLYTTVVRTTETIGNLYNAFQPLLQIMLILAFVALYALNTGMGLFNRHATIGTAIIWLLVAAYVAYNAETWIALWRGRLLLLQTALYVYAVEAWAAMMAIINLLYGENNVLVGIAIVMGLIQRGLVWGVVAAYVAWSVIMGVLNGELTLMDALLWGNPIGLVILLVIALIGLFVLLYMKSGTFRQIIRDIGDTAMVVFGYMMKAIEWIVGKLEWIASKIESIPGFHLAMEAGSFLGNLASDVVGGSSGASGLKSSDAYMGRFAGMYNTSHPDSLGQSGGGKAGLTVHTHVHIDRKQVGEAVAHYNSDKQARR